jgi:hypothetical protein
MKVYKYWAEPIVVAGELRGRAGIVAPRIPPSRATLLVTLDASIDGVWAVTVPASQVQVVPRRTPW